MRSILDLSAISLFILKFKLLNNKVISRYHHPSFKNPYGPLLDQLNPMFHSLNYHYPMFKHLVQSFAVNYSALIIILIFVLGFTVFLLILPPLEFNSNPVSLVCGWAP